MVEEIEIQALKEELIANWIDDFDPKDNENLSLPDYLKNYFLVSHIANQSNTVIQVIDMTNFKTVYTSPNCLQITGFTDVELNNTGFTYWLRTISMKQILFYVKSAKFINQKIKKLQPQELLEIIDRFSPFLSLKARLMHWFEKNNSCGCSFLIF